MIVLLKLKCGKSLTTTVHVMYGLFAAFCIIYGIIITIFCGHVSYIINPVLRQHHNPKNSNLEEAGEIDMIIGPSYRHLLLFIQISDLHLSIFQDPDRIEEFRKFCSITVPSISPAVVIASGDLTDAKYADGVRTAQFEEEWELYRDILRESGVLENSLWLDIRGNHDNFNIARDTKDGNLYRDYSVQGGNHTGSYMYTVVPQTEKHETSPSEKYSFIAVDCGLKPGPKAPWNFYGKLEAEEYEKLKGFAKESRSSNETIWFGHYPTSFILTPPGDIGVRELMGAGGARAYLAGHLHTAYGFVEKMYTIHKEGLMELELGDFKINRRIRVAAFDHGILSFTDVKNNKWPLILITNPKQVLFNNPKDLKLSRESTHIRILVFSTTKIASVAVRIDDEIWTNCDHVEGPLFVAKWEPKLYDKKVHTITVTASDEAGEESTITQKFTFDSSIKESFDILGRIILMIDVFLPYGFYLAASILLVSPLIFVRILHILVKNKRLSIRNITCGLNNVGTSLLRKVWVTATVNKLFIPLIVFPLYWPLGPWFVGELLDGAKGIAFAWGTYVEGNLLPGAFGYCFDGCVQLFWFQLPFMTVLCHCVDKRFRMLCWKENSSQFWNNLPLILLWGCQLLVTKLVFARTSVPLLHLGDLKWISIVYGVILWYFSATLQRYHFKEADVWVRYPSSATRPRRLPPTSSQRYRITGADDHGS